VQIVVTLASAASVEAAILNVAGREVAVLPEQDLTARVSTMLWTGRSTPGTKVPTGRYMVRVTARGEDGSQAQTVAVLSLGG
jgi:flagellar hook assembly protein FlgD